MHHPHVRRGGRVDDRREVLLRVVAAVLVEPSGWLRGSPRAPSAPWWPLASPLRHQRRADVAARAGPVFDDDRNAHRLRHERRHGARDQIRGAAGRVRHDDADLPRREAPAPARHAAADRASRSREPRSFACDTFLQACDHRDPSACTRARAADRPRCGSSPRLPAALLLAGRASPRLRLLAMRNPVHVLERNRPALPLVARRARLRRRPFPDHGGELLGEVEAVVDAAVHSHAAERIVEVRGVAGEKCSAPCGSARATRWCTGYSVRCSIS